MAADHRDDGLRRMRVLVVEDEMMVALLVEDMLAELGHEVVGPAARVEDALALIRSEALDVAVLDVNLDGRDVYPVAAELAARGIPFVFATGYGSAGLQPPYGDCSTVQKPYRREDLQAAIAKALVRR